MFCRECDYDISKISVSTCPECGAHFDRSDPTSFSSLSRDNIVASKPINTTLLWTMNVFVIMPIILAHLAVIDARLALGRWPRMSLDDPKMLKLNLPFYELFYPSVIAALIACLVGFILWVDAIVVGFRLKQPRSVLLGVLGAMGCIALVTSMRWSYAVEWILD